MTSRYCPSSISKGTVAALILLLSGSVFSGGAAEQAKALFYLGFEGDIIADTPEKELVPARGKTLVTEKDFHEGVNGKAARLGQPLKTHGDWYKNIILYKTPWIKELAEGTIVLWYRNPEWNGKNSWRTPAMLTTAQSNRSKPSAWQHPLSWWIFDRMVSPPEQGESKWYHWAFGDKSAFMEENTRNMHPRKTPDNQWHLWALRWRKEPRLLEVIDDTDVRDITKYESLIPEGRDHWIEQYNPRNMAPNNGISKVYEDSEHIKVDEILHGHIQLARYCRVSLDEVVVWDRALSREEIAAAYGRGLKGDPVWPPERLLKPDKKIGELVDLSGVPQERKPLPDAAKWDAGSQLERATPTRLVAKLNGLWRFHATEDAWAMPAAETWGYQAFPLLARPGLDMHGLRPGTIYTPDFKPLKRGEPFNGKPLGQYEKLWFERDVRVPAELKGRRFFFHYDDTRRVSFRLFVNGKLAGNVSARCAGHIEVTEHIRAGESNRIVVTYWRGYGTVNAIFSLESYQPESVVSAHNPYVIPDWRNRKLRVQLDLENHSDAAQKVTYSAKLFEWPEGREAHTFTANPISLKARERVTTTIEGDWKNPKEWNEETPNLYTIVLEGKVNGKVVDVTPAERFGFRELWIEDGSVYLNGKRLFLRGRAHAGWSRFTKERLAMVKATGQNCERTLGGYYPEIYKLDATDEAGMMVLFNGIGYPDLENLEPYKKGTGGMLREVGNHPSVIAFMSGGSRYGVAIGPHGHPMAFGAVPTKELQRKGEPFVVNRLFEKVDASFHLHFYFRGGCGGNTFGIMHSLSYGFPIQEMEEWISHWAETRAWAFLPIEQQIFSRPAYFWQRGSKESVILQHHARFFGERSYQMATEELLDWWKDSGIKYRWGRNRKLPDSQDFWQDLYCPAFQRVLRSWRTMKMTGCLWHVPTKLDFLIENHNWNRLGQLSRFGRLIKTVNDSVVFYIGGPEADFVTKDHCFYAGEAIEKSLILVNNTMGDLPGSAVWKAAAESGKVLGGGTISLDAKQGDVVFHRISFKAPNVTTRTNLTITASYKSGDGKWAFEDAFPAAVFPRSTPPKPPRPVAVFDTTGETVEVLKEMGLPHKWFTREAVVAGSTSFGPYSMLIIGKNSLPEAVHNFKHNIPFSHTVREGFNVLVLSQRNRNVAGLSVENLRTHRAFMTTQGSPLFEGLAPPDFIEWRGESRHLPGYQSWCEPWAPKVTDSLGDKHGQYNSFGQRRFWHWSNKGMLATFCYEKPQFGNFRCLLQNGFDLLYAPLIEYYQGRGKVVFSQLDLVDHYGVDPVATLLLERLIADCAKPSERKLGKMGYIGGAEGEELLASLAVEYRRGTRRLNVAYAELSEVEDAARVAGFLKKGGTLVVSILDQESADKLPVKVKVEERKYWRSEVPRDPVFAGLSMSDFYYRKIRDDIPQVISVDGQAPESGVVGVIPYEKGRVVYIQVDPEMFEDTWNVSKVRRIWSTVLTNVGVASKAAPDFLLIGGYGTPEEWLPGCADKVEKIDERPMVTAEQSPLYGAPALDFDPDQSYVW